MHVFYDSVIETQYSDQFTALRIPYNYDFLLLDDVFEREEMTLVIL